MPETSGTCTECHAKAADRHCEHLGCGWWRCAPCNVFFNERTGRSMPDRRKKGDNDG